MSEFCKTNYYLEQSRGYTCKKPSPQIYSQKGINASKLLVFRVLPFRLYPQKGIKTSTFFNFSCFPRIFVDVTNI